MKKTLPLFEVILATPLEDSEWSLSGWGPIPWSDFLLNPRRLRGSDFLMRWSQGKWSEERLVQAVEMTRAYVARPYGPSGVAPSGNVQEFERYFERLDRAGLRQLKRPDLLIFKTSNAPTVDRIIEQIGGLTELPFTPEDDARMGSLLRQAVVAVECENSLWRAEQMPDYHTGLTPQKRLSGKPGLKKSAVLPTVILKEEDRKPLLAWQAQHGISIHIWHVFYDRAFGLSLDEAERLIRSKLIEPTRQVFQAPGGPTTTKVIYKFYHHYAYPLATAQTDPELIADSITDKNGHILPYVRFHGGSVVLTSEAQRVLDEISGGRARGMPAAQRGGR